MTVRCGTYNFGDPRATALDVLATRADLLGCQEAGDRDRDVARFLARTPGWEQYGIDLGNHRGKVPILVNGARLAILDSGSVAMDDGEGPGKPGTGPGERKWLLWLLVRDRETGAVFYVANTHAVPSLRYRNRRRHHAEHMRRIAAWSRDLEHPVVVTMDANAKWSHDNLDPLRAAGFRLANSPGWTHKKGALKRRIDLILVRGVKVLSAEVIDTPSDHRAVVAVLDVPAVVAPKPEPEEPAVKNLMSRPSWRGRTNVDLLTILALEKAEQMRATPGAPFVITQGSYQNSVAASAGTHDGGGVIDIRWTGDDRDILALRKAGFAAWHRTPAQGGWVDHIHAVLGGHPLLAPSAARQWTAYLNGRNGLANNGPDDGPRLNPIPTFDPDATQEDDMALSDEDLDKIAYRVWAKEIGGGDNRKPARLHLINSANASLRNESARAEIAALKAAVDKGASKDDLKRMLENLDVTLQVIVSDDTQE